MTGKTVGRSIVAVVRQIRILGHAITRIGPIIRMTGITALWRWGMIECGISPVTYVPMAGVAVLSAN